MSKIYNYMSYDKRYEFEVDFNMYLKINIVNYIPLTSFYKKIVCMI